MAGPLCSDHAERQARWYTHSCNQARKEGAPCELHGSASDRLIAVRQILSNYINSNPHVHPQFSILTAA